MTATASDVSEQTVQVGETELHLLRGGSGRPVLVLHGLEGPEGWLAFHESLAANARVYAPDHPGFGETKRPEWLESISDEAKFYLWFLQKAGLDQVDLVGFGIGGWIGAEMATMSPRSLRHVVLCDPAGLRPSESSMLDIFVIPWRQVLERCVHNAADCAEFQRIYTERPIVEFGGHREAGRTMTMRMTYRPYMYSRSLQPFLARIDVPTLVVWGADDQIIPVECAETWRSSIPGAQLRILEDCGHWPHFDQPQQLAALVRDFTSK
jgi:pimeloyl-ACP methyl ester carboxylesterase